MTILAGSLLALVGADTPVGYNTFGGTMYMDHENDRLFQVEITGGPGVSGIHSLVGGSSGAEVLQATEADIFGAGPVHTISNSGRGCYHPMGKLFILIEGFLLAKIDATTLVADEIIGTSSGAPSTCNGVTGVVQRLALPITQVGHVWDGHNFILQHSFTSVANQHEVTVLQVDTIGSPLLLSAVNIAESICLVGNGPPGTFYVIGQGNPTAPLTLYNYSIIGSTITPATVYTLPNGAVSRVTVRSIAATDIDPTWTQINVVKTPGYDQADGNPIVSIGNSAAAGNKYYLCKFDGTTGAIIWKTPVTSQMADCLNLWQCYINGSFIVTSHPLGATRTSVHVFNTADGTYSTQLWNNGLSSFLGGQYDAVTNSLSGGVAYKPGLGPLPIYLGAYLAANGNVIPGSRFGRIYLGTAPPVPPPIIPGAQTGYTRVWGRLK